MFLFMWLSKEKIKITFFYRKSIPNKINLNVYISKTYNRNLGSLTEKWDIKVLTK